MLFDYHLHSLASDGYYTPEFVVKTAYRKGIKSLALTDHDTILGLAEAKSTSNQLNIEFIDGIELEADIDVYHYCHILAYYISDFEKLSKYLNNLRYERINIINSYIKKLNNLGYSINFDSINALTPGRHLTSSHIATWLTKNGYYQSFKDARASFLLPESKYYISRNYHSCEDILKLTKKCGAISVLAHPYRLHYTDEKLESFVVSLKNMGLNGIESYYATHTPKQVNFCNYLAKKYDLIVTGGSDWHGWDDAVDMGITVPDDKIIF